MKRAPGPRRRIIATVECRMTSSRLPGKVMMRSAGAPMLEHLVRRLKLVPRLDGIALATTVNATDEPIVRLAKRLKIGCFRGSENDVLKRVLKTAESAAADLIVEITGDCPLIDPELVSRTIDLYLDNDCDYASNCLIRSYPIGMDTQVFSTALLSRADREGKLPEDREHVSWYFVRNPRKFRLLTDRAPRELVWPDLRLTLDEKDDFKLIDRIFRKFRSRPGFSCGDVLGFLRRNPGLAGVNRHVRHRDPVVG